MAFYQTGSLIGVDLNGTTTTANFGLGTRVNGSDGTTWQYVQMATAVSAGNVVALGTSGTCGKASVADAMLRGNQLAFAQNAFAASDYGWVCLGGTGGGAANLSVICSGTMTANVALYLVATTGQLSTQASSSATVAGVAVIGASGSDVATSASYVCIVTWPRVNYAGH